MPGPPPAPTEIRLLKGNGKDRDVAGRKVRPSPKVVAAEPDMPDGLNEDGVRAWETILPELLRMRIAGRPDTFTLEAFCRTYQLWRAHDGGRGYPTLTANLLSLANALGCTPAARLRMIVPEAEEDDEESHVFGTG